MLNAHSGVAIRASLVELAQLVTSEERFTAFSELEEYYPTIAKDVACPSGATNTWPSCVRLNKVDLKKKFEKESGHLPAKPAAAKSNPASSSGATKRAGAPGAAGKPATKQKQKKGQNPWDMAVWS